jgi:hypothetical protein
VGGAILLHQAACGGNRPRCYDSAAAETQFGLLA